jgi:hypothetical protein
MFCPVNQKKSRTVVREMQTKVNGVFSSHLLYFVVVMLK